MSYATSTARNLSGQVAAAWQQLVVLLLQRTGSQSRAATEHAAIAAPSASTTAATFSLSVHLRVVSPITGEEIFQPLQIQRQQKVRSLLRQMQHIAYNEHHRAILIRLQCDDCILDPERPVMQYHRIRLHCPGDDSRAVAIDMGTVTRDASDEKASRSRRKSRMH